MATGGVDIDVDERAHLLRNTDDEDGDDAAAGGNETTMNQRPRQMGTNARPR